MPTGKCQPSDGISALETTEVILRKMQLQWYNGWDMYTKWTTEEYHVKHCHGSQKMAKEDLEDTGSPGVTC